MAVEEMIKTHPHAPQADRDALVQCIEQCSSCATTCTSCADSCLGEEMVQELVRCIRLDLDCADICEATGRVLTRQTSFELEVARDMLEACAGACRVCADECERHAEQHKHCRLCAEVCGRCEQACNGLVSTMG
jgi:hypothetical protein